MKYSEKIRSKWHFSYQKILHELTKDQVDSRRLTVWAMARTGAFKI
jgi:hypothetical protein